MSDVIGCDVVWSGTVKESKTTTIHPHPIYHIIRDSCSFTGG
jgi:hypothetical protein